ncbi:hypothetical protein DPMN_124863 [Dreissena polymorpha]|uniref:Uncharacterized protein n=1 Tax=Dreissena polymorpha TaxID=45954 RepID=A0A9D4GSW3_DREPO|nr:hypothetical protein DPMN_124863 [Dreissena polymorpha]
MSHLSTDNTTLTLGPRPFGGALYVHPYAARMTLGPLVALNCGTDGPRLTLVLWRCPTRFSFWRVPVGPCRRNRLSLRYGSYLPNRRWWWPLPYSLENFPLVDAYLLHPHGYWDLIIENNP